MGYSVSITDDGARDLDELYAHSHLHHSPAQAELILDRIQDVFRSLAEEPEQGPHADELLNQGIRDYRAITLEPYRIVYRIAGGDVYILMIADTRRDMQTLLQRRLLEA